MHIHTHTHVHTLQDSSPTETIPLSDLNVTMNGQTGHPNGMQITAVIRGKTRNYYVYAETGKVRLHVQCHTFRLGHTTVNYIPLAYYRIAGNV